MAGRKLDDLFIENAKIKWRNFSGKPSKFDKEGKNKNFDIIIPEDDAESLEKMGWYIRENETPDGDVEHLLRVAVSYKYEDKKPKVRKRSGKDGKWTKPLAEDEIGCLDYDEIEEIDVVINPSYYDFGGRQGIKGYLKSAAVTIKPDPLDLKYKFEDEEDPELDDTIPF